MGARTNGREWSEMMFKFRGDTGGGGFTWIGGVTRTEDYGVAPEPGPVHWADDSFAWSVNVGHQPPVARGGGDSVPPESHARIVWVYTTHDTKPIGVALGYWSEAYLCADNGDTLQKFGERF